MPHLGLIKIISGSHCRGLVCHHARLRQYVCRSPFRLASSQGCELRRCESVRPHSLLRCSSHISNPPSRGTLHQLARSRPAFLSPATRLRQRGSPNDVPAGMVIMGLNRPDSLTGFTLQTFIWTRRIAAALATQIWESLLGSIRVSVLFPVADLIEGFGSEIPTRALKTFACS